MKSEDKTNTRSVIAKKTRRRNITVTVIVMIVIMVVCLFTPAFGISDISVKGNQILSDEAVIRASGIDIGENVFRINTKKAEKEVCTLGHVKNADIRRKFPSKIVINIRESSEAAYILFAGNYVGIDLSGRVLSVSKANEIKKNKPVISGIALKSFNTGSSYVATNLKKDKALKTIFASLKKEGLFSSVKKINVSNLKNITLLLESDISILLGNNSKLDYKMTYLNKVMGEISNVRGGTIDLSDTKNVIYKGGK